MFPAPGTSRAGAEAFPARRAAFVFPTQSAGISKYLEVSPLRTGRDFRARLCGFFSALQR